MPPKKRKFESTFPAARIKKIMQLDNDVGRVASSVPVVISRAVEIFLHALLTRAAGYANSRSAKTLTVGHLKHSIEQEKQWDFLKELTAKISDVTATQEEEDQPAAPKRGRKRRVSPTQSKPPGGKRKQKAAAAAAKRDEESESESGDEGSPEQNTSEGNAPSSSGVLGVPFVQTLQHTQPKIVQNEQNLVIAAQSSSGVDSAEAVPSISALTAGLKQSSSKQDSEEDDDYDDES